MKDGGSAKALVDDLDAGRPRPSDIADRHQLAANLDRPLVGMNDAGGDAGKGGLARAVLADDRVNHALGEIDRDVRQRRDNPVVDGDVAAGERGGVPVGHRCFR